MHRGKEQYFDRYLYFCPFLLYWFKVYCFFIDLLFDAPFTAQCDYYNLQI